MELGGGGWVVGGFVAVPVRGGRRMVDCEEMRDSNLKPLLKRLRFWSGTGAAVRVPTSCRDSALGHSISGPDFSKHS